MNINAKNRLDVERVYLDNQGSIASFLGENYIYCRNFNRAEIYANSA